MNPADAQSERSSYVGQQSGGSGVPILQLHAATVEALLPLLPEGADAMALCQLVSGVQDAAALELVLDAAASGHPQPGDLLNSMLGVLADASEPTGALGSATQQAAPAPAVGPRPPRVGSALQPPTSAPTWSDAGEARAPSGRPRDFFQPAAATLARVRSRPESSHSPNPAAHARPAMPAHARPMVPARAAAPDTAAESARPPAAPPEPHPLPEPPYLPAYPLNADGAMDAHDGAAAAADADADDATRPPFWCPISGSRLPQERVDALRAAAAAGAPLIATLLPWPRDVADLFAAAQLLLNLDVTETEERSADDVPLPMITLSTAVMPANVQRRATSGDMRRGRLWQLRAALPAEYAAPVAWRDDDSPLCMADLNGLRLVLRNFGYAVAPTMQWSVFLCHAATQHALLRSANSSPTSTSSSNAASSSLAAVAPAFGDGAPRGASGAPGPLSSAERSGQTTAPAPPPQITALQRLNTYTQRRRLQATWLDDQSDVVSWSSRLVLDGAVVAQAPRWYPSKREAREATAAAFAPPARSRATPP